MMKRVHILLPEWLAEEFGSLAKRQKNSVSESMRNALTQWIVQQALKDAAKEKRAPITHDQMMKLGKQHKEAGK